MRWVNVFASMLVLITFFFCTILLFIITLHVTFYSNFNLHLFPSTDFLPELLRDTLRLVWRTHFHHCECDVFLSLFYFYLFTLNKSSMWEKFNTISVSYFYQSYNRSLFQVCDSRSLRTDAVIGEFKVRALTWVYDFYEYWTAVYCDKLGGGARVLWKLEELKHLSLCSVFHRWMWAPSTMSTVSIWLYDLNIFRCICLKKFKL